MKIETKFLPMDRVMIDDDNSIKAVVVQVRFRDPQRITYDVEWMNGSMQAAVVEEWRLRKWVG